MNQRWTLHVENFARIESADIEIAPLMCFIGDNNSGKSYVMSLLWGIMSNEDFFGKLIRNKNFTKPEIYINCKEFILEHMGEEVTIDTATIQMYLTFFNDLMNIYKEELVQKIFNHDIKISKIEIKNFTRERKLVLEIERSIKATYVEFAQGTTTILDLSGTNGNDKIIDKIGINLPIEDKKIEEALWRAIIKFVYRILMMDWLITRETLTETLPVYLPASRTGFLMTYRQIASSLVKLGFSIDSDNGREQSTLTAPYIQFIRFLLELNDTDSQTPDNHKELVDFIRSEILHGTITVKNDGNIIRYQANDITEELPLSVTSSVVTETASLLLLLTTRLPLRLIIIEEPEAHLHPALQKKIAQLLIRFVHNDIPIWITTHSDTILQHFNNMIKLNNRPEEEREELLREFGYTEEDLLAPEEINLYQFERGDKHTTIQKLQSGKYGFVIPSFNKAIDRLMSEIFAFQEDD